jgi:hypothetical protein
VVLFSNFLTIISAFKFIGVLILTIYRMLTGDILRFLIVYIILLYGFAIAMYVLVHDSTPDHVAEKLDMCAEQKGRLDVSPNQVMSEVC